MVTVNFFVQRRCSEELFLIIVSYDLIRVFSLAERSIEHHKVSKFGYLVKVGGSRYITKSRAGTRYELGLSRVEGFASKDST